MRAILDATMLGMTGRRASRGREQGRVENEQEQEQEQDQEVGTEQSPSSRSVPLPVPLPVPGPVLCLSSATGLQANVSSFADSMVGPGRWSRVQVTAESPLPRTITHGIISVPQIKALEMLKKLLYCTAPPVGAALIFVNSPHRVETVCEKLLEMGVVAAPLHGDSSKDDRREIISRLRDGRLRIAVTTELASRGLDIPELTHVINFELPTDALHYVHRAGRCGRAGRPGLVVNFARPDTKFVVRRFGKRLGVRVHDVELRQGRVFLKQR
jgi:superfamily II DNA/RNA helicase